MISDWPTIILVNADDDTLAAWGRLAFRRGVSLRGIPALPQLLPGAGRAGQDQVALAVLRAADAPGAIPAARAAFPRARIVVSGAHSDQSRLLAAGADAVLSDAGDATHVAILEQLLAEAGACRPGEPVAAVPGHRPPDAPAPADHDGLAGDSRIMQATRGFIRRLAPSRVTVLITGETGTGKDRAAVLLHRLSRRGAGPLVALNCAAIPEALLEGELFGYERGAFSGAHAAYPGKLKLADGGTLFLDEIGELSLAGQAKVLRAIETREAYRLGARAPTRFDVRIIAATNRDLAAEKAAGRFREDLFYRLAVAQLRMPPLRERPEDIVPIACHLLHELAAESEQQPVALDPAAEHALLAHDWPGNVRELRNALEVALVSAEAGPIRPNDLPATVTGQAVRPRAADDRGRLIEALQRAGGNKSLAAQALNCSRMTLYRKLARYGLAEAPAAPVTDRTSLSPGLSQGV